MTSWSGPASGPGSRVSGRTGSATPWPANCSRRGAGLAAISQVLRHQDLATTALYAKVDLDALRQVAQPWPGTARMSRALEQALADYLQLRRSLGHELAEAGWLLPGFVAYLGRPRLRAR